MPKPRVMLIGWDAADWKVIRPLLHAGEMPNLARLLAEGVHGNIATIYPVLSPMLWTSIATGKRAFKHGIHGFTEPMPDGSGVRAISTLSRKTKAIWNILNQSGRRSIVVGWWPSHPAEPLNGVMVSNHFKPRTDSKRSLLAPGTVYPAALESSLAELLVNPMELTGEFIRLFVPQYKKVDQANDKRLHTLGKIVAETMSVHAAATELLQTQTWDFAGVYYSGLDHFQHGFMRYHPPRLPWVGEEEFEIYQHVIANAYRYHDAMLGTMLGLVDESTTVILMSDHGFHPDHLRPAYIPAEPAGPAVEHRHFGILCMKGPGLRHNEPIYGATLLDICPTLLSLFGLPAGRDMDGKVLTTAFTDPPKTDLVDSWDAIPGDSAMHPAEARLDTVASAEAFRQLVELGYVAPPAANARDTVDECVRELKYNLARAYRDANFCRPAVDLAAELWERWPREHRFGVLLAECLGPIEQIERRRATIEELSLRIERYCREASEELARLGELKTEEPAGAPDNMPRRRREFEERQLRELVHPRPLLMSWLFASQALMENKTAEARKRLEELLELELPGGQITQRIASAFFQLGDADAALKLLQASLELDSEDAAVHAQFCAIYLKMRRFEDAIASAIESLSLVYFQPLVHAQLGHALFELNRFDEAEKELLVAAAQSPRNVLAHELLGKLYREQGNRGAEAFAHEGRARSLRHELENRRRDAKTAGPPDAARPAIAMPATEPQPDSTSAPFEPHVDPREVITVVSGLPRSGTSMMMQLLVAAGLRALTDGARGSDEDNPLGYYELEKVLYLARDKSWIPDARGKVVKIVAQLLPFLPPTEHYNVIFMERSLSEVIASQSAMLARQGRTGAQLDERELMATYDAQVQRVRSTLRSRPSTRILAVDYAKLLEQPETGIRSVAEFLGEPFDRDAALSAVHPEMRRQRKA